MSSPDGLAALADPIVLWLKENKDLATWISLTAALGGGLVKGIHKLAAGKGSSAKKAAVPLPQHVGRFVGRNRLLKQASRQLRMTHRGSLLQLVGFDGIGKWALAVELAQRFSNQKLVQEVCWWHSGSTPDFYGFLRALIARLRKGLPERECSEEEAVSILQALLADVPTLILIEDYPGTDERLNRYLASEVPAPSRVIVTRTEPLSLPPGQEAPVITVSGLTEAECRLLLRQELSESNHPLPSASQLQELHRATQGIPVLVRWGVSRLKQGDSFGEVVSSLAQRTSQAQRAYDAVFRKSFQALSPLQKDVLILLGVCERPLSLELIRSALSLAGDTALETLRSLIGHCLVETSAGEFYQVNDLARPYLLSAVEQERITDVRNRLYRYITAHTTVIAKQVPPDYQFFDNYASIVLKAIDWLLDEQRHTEALELQQAISRYLFLRGRWNQRVTYGEKLLPSTGRDRRKAYILMDDVAWTRYSLNKEAGLAIESIHRAMTLCDSLRDHYGSAKARRHLAAIKRDQNRADEALALNEAALTFANKIRDPLRRSEMIATLHRSQGRCYKLKQEYGRAIECFELAREGFEALNDEDRLLKVYNQLGWTYLEMGEAVESIRHFEAAASAGKGRRIDQELEALEGLARCYLTLKQHRKASEYMERALEGYERWTAPREAKRVRQELETILGKKGFVQYAVRYIRRLARRLWHRVYHRKGPQPD